MTNSNINKTIFRNLILGGIAISILTGFLIYLLEHKRIDDYVGKLASRESIKYTEYYSDFYDTSSNSSLSTLRKALQNSLDHDLFIMIEIYDNKLNRIIVENLKDINEIKDELDSKFSSFIMAGKIAHKKTYLNGQLYIKVMSPIRDKNKDKIIGHFEGIYHVSNDKIVEIKNQILLSVLQSVFIVLITTVLLYPIILQLNKKLSKRSYELLESNIHTIKSLGSAIAKRDSDTNAHNYRVTIYSARLAEKIGLTKPHIQALIKGAFLHDVGKIGISDTILLKPGKLTNDEFEIMKQHVVLGVDIIKNNKWLEDARDVVLYHHEKFDGSGYMYKFKGKNIPVNARIFAISDVFDALTSNRPYKKAFSLDKSLEILKMGTGSHFDPEFLAKFDPIAKELYMEISSLENEQVLSKHLNKLISKYFTI